MVIYLTVIDRHPGLKYHYINDKFLWIEYKNNSWSYFGSSSFLMMNRFNNEVIKI